VLAATAKGRPRRQAPLRGTTIVVRASSCDRRQYVGRRCQHYAELPATRVWLGAQLRGFGPAIVHAHLFHALALLSATRRPAGAVLLLNHQHGAVHRFDHRRVESALDRLCARRFDHVVACSTSVRDLLVDDYGCAAEKVTCVRNRWSGSPRDHDPPAEVPTVISVAHLRPAKSHDVLLRAWVDIVREVPHARLTLAGDGPLRADLEARTSSLGLRDAVHFAGAVEDVWPLLAQAHVFVLASSHEPLGIAILEAMAAGLPVVASAVGGIPEIADDGNTGFLVSPGDPVELGRALVRLLTSGELRTRMGTAARHAAAQQRLDQVAQRYIALYLRLLGDIADGNNVTASKVPSQAL
jgi:glycosyltransferase involved in cell wall biosynthesis